MIFNFIINTTTNSSSRVWKICDYLFTQVIFPTGVNYVLLIFFFYPYKPFWIPLKRISRIRILEIHPYSKQYVQTRAKYSVLMEGVYLEGVHLCKKSLYNNYNTCTNILFTMLIAYLCLFLLFWPLYLSNAENIEI